MKIILSRKGVDSSAGGFASPVLPDGSLLPVAIPDKRSPVRYREVNAPVNLGRLLKHLSKDRCSGWDRVHLDPDIKAESLNRRAKFQPAFGQCGAAQSHLASHNVSSGDLFLFFGWYRQVEYYRRRWRYVPDAPDLHVIFGWMQISQVVPVETVLSDDRYQHLRLHPHCFGSFSGSNTIYVGRDQLSFNTVYPGAGYFTSLQDRLTLTADNSSRSVWRVPDWMHPAGKESILSYHQDFSRWTVKPTGTFLRSAARGQEFVLDTAHYPQALEWVAGLLAA